MILLPSTALRSLFRPVYHVSLTKNDDGVLTAQCVEVPAAITQGMNKEEAETRIIDAIQSVLEDSGTPYAEFAVITTD